MLRVDAINKSFGGVRALRDASIEVRPHEVVGLIGENGAGKSTLMRILSGSMRPDSGVIAVDGSRVALRDTHQANECGIALVFQEQSLLVNMSVAENIFLAQEGPFTRFGVVGRGRMMAAARACLAKVGLDIDPARKAGELSFAARQMVELAKALALEDRTDAPLTILLDEPTSVLEFEGHRHPVRSNASAEGARQLYLCLPSAGRGARNQRPRLCDERRRRCR